MRQLERRRVKKLLDASHRGIKIKPEEVKFLWSIYRTRKPDDKPLSEKQLKWYESIWERWKDFV